MTGFLRTVSKLWSSSSTPSARRSTLSLESLDERVMPTSLGMTSLKSVSIANTAASRFATLKQSDLKVTARPSAVIFYPSVNNLLNKPLNLMNGNVSYGSVTFYSAAGNSNGSSTLYGTFTSGSVQIPVTATVGFYQAAGSAGYTASFSITGLVLSTNPAYPGAGYSVQFNGTLTQNTTTASVTGQLQVVVSNQVTSDKAFQPFSPVSGTWF